MSESDASTLPIPVGPHFFRLRMVGGPLLNDEGSQCMARLDMATSEILISEEVPPVLRAAVGAAAAARAWQKLVTLLPVDAVVA